MRKSLLALLIMLSAIVTTVYLLEPDPNQHTSKTLIKASQLISSSTNSQTDIVKLQISNETATSEETQIAYHNLEYLDSLVGSGTLEYGDYSEWRVECKTCAIVGAHISLTGQQYQHSSRVEIEDTTEYAIRAALLTMNETLFENLVVFEQAHGRLLSPEEIRGLNVLDKKYILD